MYIDWVSWSKYEGAEDSRTGDAETKLLNKAGQVIKLKQVK